MTDRDNRDRANTAGEEHDAGIRLGGTESLEEDGGAGLMNATYTSSATEDVAPGATRDDISNQLGGDTGSYLGAEGIAGSDFGNTDAGRTDLTGGGDAAGLGATNAEGDG